MEILEQILVNCSRQIPKVKILSIRLSLYDAWSMSMGLVRRINESGKGCGVILNELAVKNRLYCGMKSSLSFQGQDKYHLCEDCFLMFKLSQEIQTK